MPGCRRRRPVVQPAPAGARARLGDRFEEIEAAYASANELLGDIVKVTPTSKVVGDLARFAVSAQVDWDELRDKPERFDLPDSVLAYLRGELGEPAGGLPQPFASRAVAAGTDRPEAGSRLVGDGRLQTPGADRRDALSALMFPGPHRDYQEARERYGDVAVIPTRPFLFGLTRGDEVAIDLEPGVRIVVELEAIGDADERGIRTVLTRLNGQLRPLDVRDESIEVSTPVVSGQTRATPITSPRRSPGS